MESVGYKGKGATDICRRLCACMAAIIPLLTLEADAAGVVVAAGTVAVAGDMEAADMVAVDMVAVDTAQALAGMAAGLAGTTAE